MITDGVHGLSNFEGWMLQVDECVETLAGLSVHDLPDCCFADWHADGMKPATAARKAIRAAKDEG